MSTYPRFIDLKAPLRSERPASNRASVSCARCHTTIRGVTVVHAGLCSLLCPEPRRRRPSARCQVNDGVRRSPFVTVRVFNAARCGVTGLCLAD